MKIIVTGSVDFVDYWQLNSVLQKHDIAVILIRDVPGAPQLAKRYARENGLICHAYRPASVEGSSSLPAITMADIISENPDTPIFAFGDSRDTLTAMRLTPGPINYINIKEK